MKSESPANSNRHPYTKSPFLYSMIVINFYKHKFNTNKNCLNLKNGKGILKLKHGKYWLNHNEIK